MKNITDHLRASTITPWMGLIVTILAGLVIVISIDIIAFNHNKRFDLNPDRRFVISEQSKRILRSIDKDIEVVIFYKLGDRHKHQDLLQQCRDYNSRFSFKLIDLDRNPGTAQLYGVRGYNQAIIYCGDRSRKIHYPTEPRLMTSILRLVSEKKNVIYFVKGHGEKDLETNHTRVKETLEAENWEVKDVWLMKENEIPFDADILVVSGPQKDFIDSELEIISLYMRQGGKIIFMIEPFSETPRLNDFLKGYGVTPAKGIIVDPDNKLFGGDSLSPLIPLFSGHLGSTIIGTPAVFVTACGLDYIKKEKDFTVKAFAMSSPESWLKVNQEDIDSMDFDIKRAEDRNGPLPTAVLVRIPSEENKRLVQLVCFGDSDFVSDNFFDVLSNKDVFLNTVSWLSQQENLVSIRPNIFEFPYHFLQKNQVKWIFWPVVVVLPLLFLLAGWAVFLFRKFRV